MTLKDKLLEEFRRKLNESQPLYRHLNEIIGTVRGDISKLDDDSTKDFIKTYEKIRTLENERHKIYEQMSEEPEASGTDSE